jgi:hypothetical protein
MLRSSSAMAAMMVNIALPMGVLVSSEESGEAERDSTRKPIRIPLGSRSRFRDEADQ